MAKKSCSGCMSVIIRYRKFILEGHWFGGVGEQLHLDLSFDLAIVTPILEILVGYICETVVHR